MTLCLDVVDSIDIVEKNQDVINIVFHQIQTSKMSIIRDDIYNYLEVTNKKYDFIHIDVWKNLTATIKEIEKAKKMAQKCINTNGIVWCWLQELYDKIKYKLPKTPVAPGKVNVHEPCLICGKIVRYDYAGLCVGCATGMGVNDLYMKE